MQAFSKRMWLAMALVSGVALGSVGAGAQETRVQPEQVKLQLQVANQSLEVAAHLYKPPGDGPFPLVIFSHGRSSHQVERAKMTHPVLVGHANYWLKQGVAVVAPVRPGYGDTGGSDRENLFIRWDGASCNGNPDYVRIAVNARQTIAAVHQWAQQQAWVHKERVLLVGSSMGGLATMAAGALHLPGVVGLVNYSGGSGGSPEHSPGKNCQPENLTKAFAEFGKDTKIPSLWLYADNDQYWGAEMPRQWFEAFKAGGSSARFVQTGAVEGHDGHQLLARGGKMWSPPLGAFVQDVQLLAK